MKQRIEDLSVDELLTLIEEGVGCGCCGGEPERTIKAVAAIREKLQREQSGGAAPGIVECDPIIEGIRQSKRGRE